MIAVPADNSVVAEIVALVASGCYPCVPCARNYLSTRVALQATLLPLVLAVPSIAFPFTLPV